MLYGVKRVRSNEGWMKVSKVPWARYAVMRCAGFTWTDGGPG